MFLRTVLLQFHIRRVTSSRLGQSDDVVLDLLGLHHQIFDGRFRCKRQHTTTTDVLRETAGQARDCGRRLQDQGGSFAESTSSKWIVLTASHYSYEDLQQISLLEGWQLVVVNGSETSHTLQKQNVHYLSQEHYKMLGLDVESSISRKNVGHLYAIMNGAEWIYDVDGGVIPSNNTLSLFDYGGGHSGLQYLAVGCISVIERIFNPYIFFGGQPHCPHGFLGEYCQRYKNCRRCVRSCRYMRTSTIQHGISERRLSKFAPPITLKDTFSPWYSFNTLFHRRAFFVLFLSTLKGRASIVLRSFFAQKLLQILGDTTAINPFHGYQQRILRTLSEEETSEKAFQPDPKFLQFLDSWECRKVDISECALVLAEKFRDRNYWKNEDYLLFKDWVDSLRFLRYEFPSTVDDEPDLPQPPYRNCRSAYVTFTSTAMLNTSLPDVELAEKKLNFLKDLNVWCGEALPLGEKLRSVSAEQLATLHSNNVALSGKLDTVLVIINNYPWHLSLGILQRVHLPYFGLVIFCGTFDGRVLEEKGFPPTLDDFAFVDVSKEEIVRGIFLYYCLLKVVEMRLRNVRGYFVTADDLVFNFWHKIDLDFTYHPLGIIGKSVPGWYNGPAGTPALQRAVTLFTKTYKDYPAVQAVWKRYKEKVLKYGKIKNASDYLIATNGFAASDFFYVPSTEITFFYDFMEILFEARVFKGIAVLKFLASVQHIVPPRSKVANTVARELWPLYYSGDLIMLHPLKPSTLRMLSEKQRYCSMVIRTFVEVLLNL
ncbi:hypothetical protein RB195_012409 [Necator americanus]|uniref:Uncharacterized protein n=1 Tax=Necator americanus TaxID=51031 RepID=A0ABR1D7N3_NECAM